MKEINDIEDIEKLTKKTGLSSKKNNVSFTITEEIEQFDKLKTKMLKFIMYKKRTEADIRKKFKDEDQNMVEEAIGYLKELKYIDDLSYIERFMNEYIALKNMSKKELKYKLLQKGVNKDDIENYFFKNSETLNEYEKNSATNIILKKIKSKDLEEIKKSLYQKGYSQENINFAIENLEN